MKSLIVGFIGLVLSVSVGAEPLLEGRVRLSSGQPAVGVQVRLFNLTDLRRSVGTTTDAAGYFALSLQTFSTARGTALPTSFALGQNYPNPFNPSTIIPYQLPSAGHVRLEVFNVLGQRLATLVDAERSAGTHTAQWDGTDAAGRAVGAGVYIYRLSSGGMTENQRMVLVDGQAGIPAVGAAAPGPVRVVEGAVETDGSVYGLTVSGEGLVAYVDPAFRVGVNETDIVIEEHGGSPRMKLTTDRILGDVNNDGQVDVSDVLYVALYSRNPSVILPNNGDISLGDVNGDSMIDVADALLLVQYIADPSDPALPPGIGQVTSDLASSVSGTSVDQDTVLSQMYWTDWIANKIQRANLDGTNIKDLITGAGLENPTDIALDVDGDKMYWIDLDKEEIQRANLDGTNVETLVTGISGISGWGIALDVDGGKMYWTDRQGDIQRANLDGSDIETLVTGVGERIALDVDRGKMYWTSWIADNIQRANLDGTNIETLVAGLEDPAGIALDVDGDKMYWTDRQGDIQCADLDGSNIETLVTRLDYPDNIALDVDGDKMYWTSWAAGNIQRADLDGSNIETLVTEGEAPTGIALDVDEGKMYWTDRGIDKIRRANLDGSDIKDLIPVVEAPTGIALDVDEGKMYWTDSGIGKIQRANLDGTNVETLVTGISGRSITLDVDGGKMYWTTWRHDIQRANLDGTNIETLVTGVGERIALDVDRGKMYWTHSGGGIKRADLNGSNIETLITFNFSFDIVLDVDGARCTGRTLSRIAFNVPTWMVPILKPSSLD